VGSSICEQPETQFAQAFFALCPRPVSVPATLDPRGAIFFNVSSGFSVENISVAVCLNTSSPKTNSCLIVLDVWQSKYFLDWKII